ncbi:MAG: alpha/beta hydrolase [Dehalococcoidia bacterium]
MITKFTTDDNLKFAYKYNNKLNNDNEFPVLFITNLGNVSDTYEQIALRLSNNFNTILYDLRGHGLNKDIGTLLTFSQNIDDIISLLNHLNISKVNVIGNSFGAHLAIQLSSKYPHYVNSIVLEDYVPNSYLNDNFLTSIFQLDKLQSYVSKIDYINHFNSIDSYMNEINLNSLVKKLLVCTESKYFPLTNHNLLKFFNENNQELQDVSSINHPTIILRGSRSSSIDSEAIQKIVMKNDLLRSSSIEMSNSMPHLVNSDIFLSQVTKFLSLYSKI